MGEGFLSENDGAKNQLNLISKKKLLHSANPSIRF